MTFSPPKSISALWAIAPDHARREVRGAQAARSHALAVDQAARPGRTPHRTLGRRDITHEHERHAPLELDL